MKPCRAAALLAAALATASGAADAQLYRWRDPETGSVKLSSVPPPWYGRGVSNGPHVDVVVEGRLVDPLARPRAPAAAADGAGPLPPPRVPLQPPDATREQLAAAVVAGSGVREQLGAWARGIALAVEQDRSVPAAAREQVQALVRSAFAAERLEPYFMKAFTAGIGAAELREVIELAQTPLGRRTGGLEASRGRRLMDDPQQLVAAEARASAERRALADAIEQASGGADLMTTAVAGAAAALALNSPEEARARIADTMQRQRAEMLPMLRQLYVRMILFVYEPLSDAELRAVLDVHRRPAVARFNQAVALGYAAALQEGLSEFIAGAKPVLARR